METFKKILQKLLFPPLAVIILLVPISIALLVYTFAFGSDNDAIAYVTYVLSAYALTVICCKTPVIFKKAKNVKQENRYIQMYVNDPQLRVKISLYFTLALNCFYAVLQLFSGFYYHSIWFYALSGYYAILAVTRFFLLKHTLKGESGKNLFLELLIYRFCGVLLLLMNLFLGVIVTFIVWQNRGFARNEILTIAMAAYTFTSLTFAVIDIVKYRKYNSPVLSSAKVMSLTAALVSMLSLETSMLSAFGADNGPQFRRIMTGSTGAAVCVFVVVMAVYMIVHSTKQINSLKKEGKQSGKSKKQ